MIFELLNAMILDIFAGSHLDLFYGMKYLLPWSPGITLQNSNPRSVICLESLCVDTWDLPPEHTLFKSGCKTFSFLSPYITENV